MKKSIIRDAIVQQLQQELTRQTTAAETSHDEAISEESRAENKWDTHSQEAAYLAEGQAKLALEISGSIELYATLPLTDFAPTDAVALGAVVEVEPAGGGERTRYFIGPRAGGLELVIEGRPVLVLTPQSPLGRQLIGKHLGDELEPARPGERVRQQIVSVA